MKYLRRISTRRLLALCAATCGRRRRSHRPGHGSNGGGPKPPAEPLPVAVHDALTAPTVQGVTARIHFTNDLIGGSSVQGADPLLTGASGRLWATSDGQFRLELQADSNAEGATSDSQVLSDGHTLVRLRLRLQHGLQGNPPRRSWRRGWDELGEGAAAHARPGQAGNREARRARSGERSRADRYRGPAGLHRPRRAQAQRRPSRRRRARLGRGPRHAPAGRRLREGRQLAGARAEGHRHLLRRLFRLRSSTSLRRPTPRSPTSARRPTETTARATRRRSPACRRFSSRPLSRSPPPTRSRAFRRMRSGSSRAARTPEPWSPTGRALEGSP